jgi:hypothetical protein
MKLAIFIEDLPCFGSFGQAVSVGRFKKIDQSETRIACGGHVC